MPAKQKRENSHIPLVMFGLAKRAAIDVRLINPDLPDEPGSKVNNAVREILADLKSTDHYKGTALSSAILTKAATGGSMSLRT